MRRAVLILLAAALFGCGDHPTYYSDVKPILDARCTGCHQSGGIAPFALTSYAEAQPHAEQIKTQVSGRIMPPWLAAKTDVTYRHNPSLDDKQIATLVHWVDDKAPAGDPHAKPKPLPDTGGGLARVDVQVGMSEPYMPVTYPDQYRCFPIPWTEATKKYVTGFNATPGNAQIVHHAAIYLIPPDSADLPVKWDAEEAGPGYDCYGAPYGDRPQTFPVQLLAAWIPGYQGVSFPDGLGIEVDPNAMLVLQMHYNLANVEDAAGEKSFAADQTQLMFSIADSVDTRAAYAPYLNVAWVAGSMQIPAGNPSVVHNYKDNPQMFFDLFGVPIDTSKGFRIWAAMFHMHELGQQGYVRVHHRGGSTVEILNIPKWEFHWQREYYLQDAVSVGPNDDLELQCVFDNSASGQPVVNGAQRAPHDVNWGETSEDEMCVVNLLITE
jgi:hypothetical protein